MAENQSLQADLLALAEQEKNERTKAILARVLGPLAAPVRPAVPPLPTVVEDEGDAMDDPWYLKQAG